MLALSQLSYGPESRKSSGEFVVLGPVDQSPLIVSCGRDSQQDDRTIYGHRKGQEVALVRVRAIRSDCVDIGLVVAALDQAVWAAPTAPAVNDDDVPRADGPLALHTKQAGSHIEDQVLTLVGQRPCDANSDFQRSRGNFYLGDSALLIGGQVDHLPRLAAASDSLCPK